MIPVNNAEKNIWGWRGERKHNSKLSSESPYSILHIASISLCIIFFHTNSEGGAGNEITESSTQHRTESDDEGQFNCDRAMMHPFNIVHKSLYKFIQTAV